MSKIEETAERLRHDLGKYLQRTARNVDATAPLDDELLAMLCEDLYATARGQRASQLYATLTGAAAEPRLVAQLAELDALEAGVRRNDRASVRRAIAIALAVAAAVGG